MNKIGLPKRMEIKNQHDSLTISRQWFSWYFMPVVAIFMVMDTFIFSLVLNSNSAWERLMLIGMVLLSIYYLLTIFLNKTTIVVTRQEIQVSHSPLPSFGCKKIKVNDITQLYTKKVFCNQNGQTSYSVYVIKRNGTDEKLVSGFISDQQATYTEQQIAQYLGI